MHDARGQQLSIGDVVYIPAKVTQVSAEENYCNVNVETLIGRRPDGQKERNGGINTGVLIKASVEEAAAFAKEADELNAKFVKQA